MGGVVDTTCPWSVTDPSFPSHILHPKVLKSGHDLTSNLPRFFKQVPQRPQVVYVGDQVAYYSLMNLFVFEHIGQSRIVALFSYCVYDYMIEPQHIVFVPPVSMHNFLCHVIEKEDDFRGLAKPKPGTGSDRR